MNEKQHKGKIDIVCGGQFGDEGKGAIIAYLITQRGYKFPYYDFAVRVGGYNAEHRIVHAGKKYTFRVLPCAAIEKSINLYIGAGHIFSPEALLAEIKENDINIDRVFIDKNAGIVSPTHQMQSRTDTRDKRGGSTFQGAGKASAHKVLRDGEFITAENCPALKRFQIICVADRIREDLNAGKNGLLEGSQGALLSLNHGYYPFCCAKDVTPAGMIAEAGIGIYDIRDIYAIYRAYPMRVPGKSGPTGGKEISWEELSKRTRVSFPEETKRQTLPDGSKGDTERIFEWDQKDYKKSIILCSPTKLVFTFADWHHPDNLGKIEYGHIHLSTQEHLMDMAAIAKRILGRTVSMSLIKTGPKEEDIIDGGIW